MFQMIAARNALPQHQSSFVVSHTLLHGELSKSAINTAA